MNTTLTPFKATVDQSLIRNASSFFDNSSTSILRELLQNSRRSGATEVRLFQQGKRWIYSDNGPGCDPQELLGLGTSRWGVDVSERESPAGCGFFSLARRNPTITCPARGWEVSLTEGHFNGQLDVEPREHLKDAGDARGMVIAYDATENYPPYGLNDMARYMPLDFYLNGDKKASRQDFLAGSDTAPHRIIRYSEHITIRVDLVRSGDSGGTACYNGFVVTLPSYTTQLFGTIHGAKGILGRVMVTRESALPLELPQRNAMIKSPECQAIAKLIYCTGLELAAEALDTSSVCSPSLWLDARLTHGYTGPVLYPKFIGRLLTRTDNAEMEDHTISLDSDGDSYEHGRHITLDEFVAGDYKIWPGKEVTNLIAQTTIPSTLDETGKFSTYDIDTDEYFAPGLRMIEPLESLKHLRRKDAEAEGAEWINRFLEIKDAGSTWCEEVSVVATAAVDGKTLTMDEYASGSLYCDASNIYDTIQLEFREDGADAPNLVLPTAALFNLEGGSDDTDLDFIITRKWLDEMPNSFPDTIAEVVAEYRKFRESDSYDDDPATADKVAEKFRVALAEFGDAEKFHTDKLMEAVADDLVRAVHHLPKGTAQVVLTMALGGRYDTSVLLGSSSCVCVPKFEPYYTFEGSHGEVACDEQGRRDPSGRVYDEQGRLDPSSVAYPEFHSFDVETMKQIGLHAGPCDILDACGWHDSTKKIYVTPAIAHLLHTVGACAEPSCRVDSPEIRAALIQAIKDGLVSSTLYSALWYENQALVQSIASAAMEDLPPISKLWIYTQMR